MRLLLTLLLALACAACATATVGEATAGSPFAYLSGDPRFNAGLPVVVVLRKVDDVELGPFYSRAALGPGPHHAIVDCTVAASQSTSRFVLDLDAEPRMHYQLVADLAPGNQHCAEVRIEVR